MISIQITDADRNVIRREYGETIQEACFRARKTAAGIVNAQRPTLYLRDCLGGLRSEIRWRDGKVYEKKT